VSSVPTPSTAAPADLKPKLMQIVFGGLLNRTVYVIAQLGIADLIPPGSSRPIEKLAAESGADARSLYRSLRFLASRGIFAEEKGGGRAGHGQTFAHTPLSELLRQDHPESSRAAFLMFGFMDAHALQHVDHTVRTGGSALTKGLGMPVFDYLPTNPEQAAIVDAAMTAIHGPETGAMLASYDFSGIGTLADLGGGNGSLLIEALLIEALGKYPGLKGILMDLGHVVDRAKANLAAAGLADRCSVAAVNFFESVPSGADAYLMRHIIHDWTDEQSVQILRNVRAAMPAHGRLLLVESVVPTGNEPSIAKDMDRQGHGRDDDGLPGRPGTNPGGVRGAVLGVRFRAGGHHADAVTGARDRGATRLGRATSYNPGRGRT